MVNSKLKNDTTRLNSNTDVDSYMIAIDIIKSIPSELQDQIVKYEIFINMTVIEMIQFIGTNKHLDRIIIEGLTECEFEYAIRDQRVTFQDTGSYVKRYLSLFNLSSWMPVDSRNASKLAKFMMRKNVKSQKARIECLEINSINSYCFPEFLEHCFMEVEEVDPDIDVNILKDFGVFHSSTTSLRFHIDKFGTFPFSSLPKLIKVSIKIDIENESWITPELRLWCEVPTVDVIKKHLTITIKGYEAVENSDYSNKISSILSSLQNYKVLLKFNYEYSQKNPSTIDWNRVQYAPGVLFKTTHFFDDLQNTSNESIREIHLSQYTGDINLLLADFKNLLDLKLTECVLPCSLGKFSYSVLKLQVSFCDFSSSKFTIPQNVYNFIFETRSIKFPEVTNSKLLLNLTQLKIILLIVDGLEKEIEDSIKHFIGFFDLSPNPLMLQFHVMYKANYMRELDLRGFRNFKWLIIASEFTSSNSYNFANLPSELEYLDFNVERVDELNNSVPLSLRCLKINLHNVQKSLVKLQRENLVHSSLMSLEISAETSEMLDLRDFQFQTISFFYLLLELKNYDKYSFRYDFTDYEETERLSSIICLPEYLPENFIIRNNMDQTYFYSFLVNGINIENNIDKIECIGFNIGSCLRIKDYDENVLFSVGSSVET